ncbi:MAG: amino acid permease [Frankiales bacterium]|nr:amino acid permease [Frankiales bacterium]
MSLLKRALVGTPIDTALSDHTLLSKRLALPVFCSDPLSSVAYATDEILLVLVLGGSAALAWTPTIALAVVALLVVVVTSYRRTVHAYPGGGGAYAVARDQFGQRTALVAASALVVDYILTVAVSVTSGVANFASAFPALGPHAVALSLALVVVLTVVNLRGIRESGRAFAAPTYLFVGSVLLLVVVGGVRLALGQDVVAESSTLDVHAAGVSGATAVFLLLRAFASGCTALTGVEAVSNGVPYFRPPKARNAAGVLLAMGALAVTMFGGVTFLAVRTGVRISEDNATLGLPADAAQPTVLAQLGQAVFGAGSLGFYALQIFTTAILVLAANTAYNSFPIMGSVLGRDGYLPRQFGRRGDRLVFSNGILVLAAASALLIVAFDASVTRLVQLYIIGVFLSFTISQAGMVKRWTAQLRTATGQERGPMLRSRAVNAVGALVTGLVLLIVVVTKFTHGAWLVIIAIPLFFTMMVAIHRHYRRTDERLAPSPGGVRLPSRVHAVVLVSRLHAPAMQALAFARASRPDTLVALHVESDDAESEALQKAWSDRRIPVPLVSLESPYRDLTAPVLEYVRRVRRESPRDMVAVYIPEYVPGHWWEALLHNQSALRLHVRLRRERGVIVVAVPLLVDDAAGTPAAPAGALR